MKNKVLCIITCLILCALFCGFSSAPVYIENAAKALEGIEEGSIYFQSSAEGACVMDASFHRIFYQKNQNKKLPMASTTKIVTAIAAIENHKDLDTKVRIHDNAIGVEGSSIYLREGEMLSLRELLYGLMLRSGNDAATAIAYLVAGGIPQFAELMNNLALKVGATNSHFTNPHGLDDPNHYTTAYDLALITSYALDNEDFANIVQTKTIKICEGEENYRYLVNKNKLLFNMDDCIGVKTGYTKKSGRCLVSATNKDGMKIVCVVLNCGPMFEESKQMLDLVNEKYSNVEILEPYHYYKSIPVKNGEKGEALLYSRRGLSLPLSCEERSSVKVEFEIKEELEAPVKNEEVVGCVKVYYGKHLIFSENVYTIDYIDSRLLKDKVKDILNEWSI